MNNYSVGVFCSKMEIESQHIWEKWPETSKQSGAATRCGNTTKCLVYFSPWQVYKLESCNCMPHPKDSWNKTGFCDSIDLLKTFLLPILNWATKVNRLIILLESCFFMFVLENKYCIQLPISALLWTRLYVDKLLLYFIYIID